MALHSRHCLPIGTLVPPHWHCCAFLLARIQNDHVIFQTLLSNTKDVTFYDKKVGKNQNGDYLIKKVGGKPNVSILKILEIDDNQIKFESAYEKIIIYNAVK